MGIFLGLNIASYYFVDSSIGVDDAGRNGRPGQEWLTLSYAISRVSAGDVIFLNSGTHEVSTQIAIPVGVSITGAGDTSILHSSYSTYDITNITDNLSSKATLLLSSASTIPVAGNQSISYIKMDGTGSGVLAHSAVVILGRDDISIHHCSFSNFALLGVKFGKITAYPLEYMSNNSFHHNTLTNCAGIKGTDCRGSLEMAQQNGMLVYSNSFDESVRADAVRGFSIKAIDGSYKNCNIYSNTINRPLGGTFSISIEFWNSTGNNKIHDNDIKGGYIDIVEGAKGDYTYSVDIYKNTIYQDALVATTITNRGIVLESNAKDVIIRQNSFTNFYNPIVLTSNFTAPKVIENVKIYYNIFKNIGATNNNGGGAIQLACVITGNGIQDIYIDNNVVFDDNTRTYKPWYGVHVTADHGTFQRIYARNNIFQGFTRAYIAAQITNSGDPTLDLVYLQNNITYSNGNSNDPWYAFAAPLNPTNVTNEGNIKSDPMFVTPGTDFHLQNGSPAINAGLDLDYEFDYDGIAVGVTPEIGAYEYV